MSSRHNGGNGSCNTTLNSTVTGTTVVEASTTVNRATVPAVPADQELKIRTDGTGFNSGPAVKHWIDGTLVWEKHDNSTPGRRLGGATFEVCRTRDYALATGTFTVLSTPVCFTPDILDNDARDQDKTNGVFRLTGLRLGTYRVRETIAPPDYILDPSPRTADVTTSAVVTVGPFVNNLNGRMTGGTGKVYLIDEDSYLTAGFTIHCDIKLSNNLEINWKDDAGNSQKWHITKPIKTARCIDTDADPERPTALFDTFIGTAEGELNGAAGSSVEFIFVDSGEPGKGRDVVRIVIWPGAIGQGQPVLSVGTGALAPIRGNIQAHLDQPHRNK